jgi:hypothetical protein
MRKCESKMHILANCPLTPENGLLSSNGAKTDSDDGVGHSIDDQRDSKVHYDPEDFDSPPLRNLRSGQSRKSSGESGNNSDDQNDSQVRQPMQCGVRT